MPTLAIVIVMALWAVMDANSTPLWSQPFLIAKIFLFNGLCVLIYVNDCWKRGVSPWRSIVIIVGVIPLIGLPMHIVKTRRPGERMRALLKAFGSYLISLLAYGVLLVVLGGLK